MFSLLESACPLALSTHTPLTLQSKFWFFRQGALNLCLILLTFTNKPMIHLRFVMSHTGTHANQLCIYVVGVGTVGTNGLKPRQPWVSAPLQGFFEWVLSPLIVGTVAYGRLDSLSWTCLPVSTKWVHVPTLFF